MDQQLINWIIAGTGTMMGFLLNAMWQAVKDLQNTDKQLASKVAEIEVLVAGDYPKRSEINEMTAALFKKLDRIEEKLDKKVDKQ